MLNSVVGSVDPIQLDSPSRSGTSTIGESFYIDFAVSMDRSKVYFTREQSRLVDQLAIKQGIAGLTLMENAAAGCVEVLMEDKPLSVVIFAGTGNNGGDGFVIARMLAGQGVKTKTILCGPHDKISGDALTNYQLLYDLPCSIKLLDDSWTDDQLAGERLTIEDDKPDWIIDAMLGTGASGSPRPPIDRVIRIANSIDTKKMAIDIPSGLDCDTGEAADPTFIADLTCSFVTQKTGFQNEAAKPYLGSISLVSIGVPDEILLQILSGDIEKGTQ